MRPAAATFIFQVFYLIWSFASSHTPARPVCPSPLYHCVVLLRPDWVVAFISIQHSFFTLFWCFSSEGNFLFPNLFRFKNIVPLWKYSAVLQNWADWPGQAGTNKWSEWNEICRFKKIVSLWPLRNYPQILENMSVEENWRKERRKRPCLCGWASLPWALHSILAVRSAGLGRLKTRKLWLNSIWLYFFTFQIFTRFLNINCEVPIHFSNCVISLSRFSKYFESYQPYCSDSGGFMTFCFRPLYRKGQNKGRAWLPPS